LPESAWPCPQPTGAHNRLGWLGCTGWPPGLPYTKRPATTADRPTRRVCPATSSEATCCRRLRCGQFLNQPGQRAFGVLHRPGLACWKCPQVQASFGHVNADDCFYGRHVLHSLYLRSAKSRTTLPCNTGSGRSAQPLTTVRVSRGNRRGDLADSRLRTTSPRIEVAYACMATILKIR